MKAVDYFSVIDSDLISAIEKSDYDAATKAITRGANPNASGRDGIRPVYWMIVRRDIAGLKYLLAHGASPDAVTIVQHAGGHSEATSALHVASIMEDRSYLEALLMAGANPDIAPDKSGKTPMFAAVENERIDNIDLLLKHGASIDATSQVEGQTPLLEAVYGSRYRIALLLLEKGANPNIPNKWGSRARDVAVQFGIRNVAPGSAEEGALREFLASLGKGSTPTAASGH